ncbi:hypothetical protein EV193_10678 [Herbihabitans rhizosphaerae]|uniref:Excreted virulence factor EspC (Type VII ESX diderm) n=1 Tax=Herbihabitans rhizosphaerae TaxID=1872711 RepID=A0A4Q7KKV0_9PSEU|nr:hypothetical protein [Herbihabitans rhizosphaerae]RZS36844.1 hypothetical protein EV193_10678 [Herbihabitans rhizosphaerae]
MNDPHHRRPSNQGYDVDTDALTDYARRTNPVSDEVRGAAGMTGADFDDYAFSKIGSEVGLSSALRDANQRQRDDLAGLSTNMDNIAQAVHNTGVNYTDREDQGRQALRRAAREE